MKFKEAISEGFFSKMKNKFKNSGMDWIVPGHTLFSGGRVGEFPDKLVTIKETNAGEDYIKYTMEDIKGKITTHEAEYREFMNLKFTGTDWIDERDGSGIEAWRMKITNMKKELLVRLENGSKLKGKKSDMKLKEETMFYLPINKDPGSLHITEVYTDMNFSKDTKFECSTFDIKWYD